MFTFNHYRYEEEIVKDRLGIHYRNYKPMSFYDCCIRRELLQGKSFKHEAYFNSLLRTIMLDQSKSFIRNACIGNRYFGDFVNLKRRIIIEIDEEHHRTPKAKIYDRKRDFCLNKLGFKVIRLPVSRKDNWATFIKIGLAGHHSYSCYWND